VRAPKWIATTDTTLRRAAVGVLVAPQLRAPVATLLARLPAAVCALPLGEAARLPAAFRREFCPALGGGGSGTGRSWAGALAEYTMTADPAVAGTGSGGGSSVAAGAIGGLMTPDAWQRQMCG
jgi:hypothetical protein